MSQPTPGVIPGLGNQPPRSRIQPRHPLRLPAGSVRGLLALSILGALWLVVIFILPTMPREETLLYVYLQYLLLLILGSYFAAHGSSIKGHPEEKSPLGLPRGAVRFLLLAGYLGLIVWLYHTNLLFEHPPTAPGWLPIVLLGAFLLGYLITRIVSTLFRGVPYWFQDFQAWLAILAMIGLGIELLYYLFVRQTVPEHQRPDLKVWEGILAGIIGFYFGARS